jgi:hypothetical protein
MLIPVSYLLDRWRQPRSRADEALALRRRFSREPAKSEVSSEEAAASSELRALRLALSQAIGSVESCRHCAIGHPPPHGHFAGGHCCGLQTEDAFNDDEVAALRQAGTTLRELRLPRGDHAGCAFRGATGCSLSAPDRPNLCLRYVCNDLARELNARGDLPAIEALSARMEEVYLRFITLRRERIDAEEVAKLKKANS